MDLLGKYKSDFMSSVGDILSDMSKECEKIAQQDSKEEVLFNTNTRFFKLKVFRNEKGIYFTRSFGDQKKTSKITKKTSFTFSFGKKSDTATGFEISSGSNGDDGTYAKIEIEEDGSMKVDFTEFARNIEGDIIEVESNVDASTAQASAELESEFSNINSQLVLILDNQSKMSQTMQTQYTAIQANFESYKDLYKSSVTEIENTVESAVKEYRDNINSEFDNLINTMDSEFSQLEAAMKQYADDNMDQLKEIEDEIEQYADEAASTFDKTVQQMQDEFAKVQANVNDYLF